MAIWILFPLLVFATLTAEIPQPRAGSSLHTQTPMHGRATIAAHQAGVILPKNTEAGWGQTDAHRSKASKAVSEEHLYFLPQVAVGRYEEGSFRTTFVIFNPNDDSAVVSVQLTREYVGWPMAVEIPELSLHGEHFEKFTLTLDPGSIRILEASHPYNLMAGGAAVRSNRPIGISAIFTVYDRMGRFVSEAGVGGCQAGTDFAVPFEVSESCNTGVAFLNTDNNPLQIEWTLYSESGFRVGWMGVDGIMSGGHDAVFIAGPDSPPNWYYKGTMLIHGSVPIAVLALRQTQQPLCYTSLPVVDVRSQNRAVNLPQVANGWFGAGFFRTSFLVFGLTGSPMTAVLDLFNDDGSAWAVSLTNGQSGSRFELNSPQDGSSFMTTTGEGPLTSGSATVTAGVPVAASAIFTVFSEGRFLSEAGVGDSPPMKDFTLPVDISGDFDTGVAFFNPGSSDVTLSLRLVDASGKLAATGSMALGKQCHTAKFVSQIFPGTSIFRGTLAVNSSGVVTALTLRQHTNPLCYTTLPVAEGTIGAGDRVP